MSYLVLARKSRPQTFAQVVGQKPVVRTLQNGLRQNRIPHALIFSGVRGTGKTTLARIMAKALNCEQGPPPEPCNQCRSCREIMAGSSIDLHEVDGASNRGIQEIRELKENIRFMPVNSRFKIIIIDEVHMLTTEAFNALLKTLEEPPEHVYFMFATTELHKVPVTILSRCQRYELKRVAHAELAAHFASLAEQEGVSIDEAALNMVVREAGGSVRDGLSLLDQVFSYCGDTVTGEEVADVLGLVSHEVIADIARALLGKDLAAALAGLEKVYSYGMDIKRFINELLGWFRSLVVCRISQEPGPLLDLPADELALLRETAAAHSSETLFMLFNLLLDGLEKAAFSARPRFAVEMVFIRAVQVEDVVPVTELLGRLDKVLAGVALPQQAVIQQTSIRQEPSSRTGPAAEAEKKKPRTGPEPVESPPHPAASSGQKTTPQSAAEPAPQPEQKAPPKRSAVPPAGKKDIRKHWPEFIDYVRDRHQWMAAPLQLASSARLEDGKLIIQYDDTADYGVLKDREKLDELTVFAADFFQKNLQIEFYVPHAQGCEADPSSAAAVEKKRKELANDPLVLAAVEIFNGHVGDIRVGARYRTPLASEKVDK
ncbi:MAG: DNA polymerase III subunit gamma/tau [Candidatus Electrothrix sp. YB6]